MLNFETLFSSVKSGCSFICKLPEIQINKQMIKSFLEKIYTVAEWEIPWSVFQKQTKIYSQVYQILT